MTDKKRPRSRPPIPVFPGAAEQLAAALGDAEIRRWREFARCGETDPDAFMPDKGESGSAALSVCRRCEVRVECLADALDQAERHGIRGGLGTRARRELLAAYGPTVGDMVRTANGLPARGRRHSRYQRSVA